SAVHRPDHANCREYHGPDKGHTVRPRTNSIRYNARRMMAPTTDIRKPAPSFGPYQPSARPRNPPNSAPAMPSHMVMMNPPGSRQGCKNFAMPPTINPNMIQPITPSISVPLLGCGGANSGPQLLRPPLLLRKTSPHVAAQLLLHAR